MRISTLRPQRSPVTSWVILHKQNLSMNLSDLRQLGIGPRLTDWKSVILPLNYWCRMEFFGGANSKLKKVLLGVGPRLRDSESHVVTA